MCDAEWGILLVYNSPDFVFLLLFSVLFSELFVILNTTFMVFFVTLIHQNISDALQRVCNQIIRQFWGLVQACFSVELFAGISMILVCMGNSCSPGCRWWCL